MPPRYAYWTIIVDNQPTAFRSGSQEELMPTFKRLKARNDTAVMMWFQNGKLWPSRVDAQEMMHARGEMGRRGDERQAGFRSRDRDFKPSSPHGLNPSRASRTAWTPRGEPSTPPPPRTADDKLDWKPKGEFVPAPKRAERPDWKSKPSSPQAFKPSRSEKPEWKPKGSFTPAPRRSEKPDWKPKGSFDRERKSEWQPRDDGGRFAKPDWKSKAPRSDKPEWKPKGSFDRERRPASKSFDREERPRSFKRPDFKSSGDDTRSAKPEWKPKGSFDRERKPDWKSKTSRPQAFKPSRSERPEWKPKGESSSPQALKPSSPEKRKWVPKEEYKKSMGIEAKRDSKWRPGGEHKDPRQKYKDAKKAKWTKFKQNIRARSGGKGKKN